MAQPNRQIPKSNRPRSTSLLTRNDRVRLKPLSVAKLTEMREVSTNKRLKGKINGRLAILAKRSK